MNQRVDRRFFIVLFVILGVVSFALVFVPPFFKESGLIGAGILLTISVLSLVFAGMIHRG